jgi:hypothetical protein
MTRPFSKLYKDAEECIDELRKAVDEESDLEDVNDLRFALCNLRSYLQNAINETDWLRDKFFKE